MFGAPKISANLSISRILEIASNLNGSPNLFDQLIPLTETSDKRYQLAKRYQRHRIVIDVRIIILFRSEIKFTNNIFLLV